jgi:hypothetical protein
MMPAPMREKVGGLFVNRHRKAGALQKTRNRQAAQSGADDGDLRFSIHP